MGALQSSAFDIMLSDIGLPSEDGYALLKRARRMSGARIPTIALTAYASRDDCARALAAGFDSHLAKPIDASALIGAVDTLVRSASRQSA